jgi:hypothetical protein
MNTTYNPYDEHIRVLYKDNTVSDIAKVDNALIHQQLSSLSKNITFATLDKNKTALKPVIFVYLDLKTLLYMQFTAAQISILVSGKIDGSADTAVTSFGKIEEAEEGQLTFLANPKYEDFLYTTNASIAIINESYELRQPVRPTLIRVADAYSAFALLLSAYQEMANRR